MSESNLTRWKAIRLYLKAARFQIPETETTRKTLQQFDEYLIHNELGLAHGLLKELKHAIPESEKKEYLINCCAAAGLMAK